MKYLYRFIGVMIAVFTLVVPGLFPLLNTLGKMNNRIQLPAGGGMSLVDIKEGQLSVSRKGHEFIRTQTSDRIDFSINGTAHEDDCFRVEFSVTARGCVHVEGGVGGFDILDIVSDVAKKVTHHFYNAHDGNVEIDFDGDARTDFTIEYTGLEPVMDNTDATDREFIFTGGTETITITDLDSESIQVGSTLGETVTFTNPSNSLVIDAGTGDDIVTVTSYSSSKAIEVTIEGGAGNDDINVTSFNMSNAAEVTFSGGAGDDDIAVTGFTLTGTADVSINGDSDSDTFSIDGSMSFGSGTLTVNTETMTTTQPLSSASGGNMEIYCDNVAIGANIQSSGMLMIMPANSGTTLGLGGGSGSLNLDDTELNYLADGFTEIIIGDGESGNMNISSATFNDPVNLVSGGNIYDGSGTDITSPAVAFFGNVSPGQSIGALKVSGDAIMAEGSEFAVEIGGEGTENHDQLIVTGSVSIGTNVTLNTSSWGGYIPSNGASFTVIDNDGADKVTGTFQSLGEGAIVSSDFLGSGMPASITYEGGDNENDVVITVDASLPVELAAFSVICTSEGVLIEWATESETDNVGFILEKSVGTVHESSLQWDVIASYQTHENLKGQGNTSSRTAYAFTDVNVLAGDTYVCRLSDVDTEGNITIKETLEMLVTQDVVPEVTDLLPAWPNPFNPETKIKYQLAEAADVNLSVIDITGRIVQSMVRGERQRAGNYILYWNGKNDYGQLASSGVYFLVLRAGSILKSQKVLLVR